MLSHPSQNAYCKFKIRRTYKYIWGKEPIYNASISWATSIWVTTMVH